VNQLVDVWAIKSGLHECVCVCMQVCVIGHHVSKGAICDCGQSHLTLCEHVQCTHMCVKHPANDDAIEIVVIALHYNIVVSRLFCFPLLLRSSFEGAL